MMHVLRQFQRKWDITQVAELIDSIVGFKMIDPKSSILVWATCYKNFSSWTNIISIMLSYFPQTTAFFKPFCYKNCSVLTGRRLALKNKGMDIFFHNFLVITHLAWTQILWLIRVIIEPKVCKVLFQILNYSILTQGFRSNGYHKIICI